MLGVQTFVRGSGDTIEERLQADENRPNPKKLYKIEFTLMGQDVAKSSPPEIASLLLKRDYPDLHDFEGEKKVGLTMVPEGWLPKMPKVVDPNIERTDETSK